MHGLADPGHIGLSRPTTLATAHAVAAIKIQGCLKTSSHHQITQYPKLKMNGRVPGSEFTPGIRMGTIDLQMRGAAEGSAACFVRGVLVPGRRCGESKPNASGSGNVRWRPDAS